MSNFILIKRVIFWIEAVVTYALLGVGIFISISTAFSSGNYLTSIIGLFEFGVYLLVMAIESFVKAPFIASISIVYFSMYVVSLFYFSQTEKEKSQIKFLVPCSIFGIWFIAIGVVSAAMAGLAMQGGGK